MKISFLVRAIRLRREEIMFDDEQDRLSLPAKLLKHRKNKERTTRTIRGTFIIVNPVSVRAPSFACMQASTQQ